MLLKKILFQFIIQYFNRYGAYTLTEFETTPPTSPYLIAFIISDFKYIENSNATDFRYRIFANTRDFKTAAFAVNESEKLLNAISEYLDLTFSLPKMDQGLIISEIGHRTQNVN